MIYMVTAANPGKRRIHENGGEAGLPARDAHYPRQFQTAYNIRMVKAPIKQTLEGKCELAFWEHILYTLRAL